jgi:hypothetical protein
MAIFTPEQLKYYLRIDISTDEDSDVEGVIDATGSMLTKVSGRVWDVASGTPSTRYYAPREPGQDLIRIHDCVSVSSVTNDGETVPVWSASTGGYQLEPLNGMDWAGESRPYEGIRYINSWWKFDGFRGTVAVTADWGWAAIPAQVERAAYVLAKDIWTFRGQEPQPGVEEFLEAKAKLLLKGYRREEAKMGIGGPR